jgi:DNA invertase Pin-like site-specific DNA recombinase
MAKRAKRPTTAKPEKTTSKVYGYVRVSTVVQADGESLAAQQRKIEGRALELDKTLDHVYVETGVSGSKPLEQRPQGKALLHTVQSGDIIIASKLDRMFRSAADALRVIEAFRKRSISLYLLDLGGNCTTDGIAKLVVTIMSAVAEFERFRTRERVLEMVEHRRHKGLSLGGAHPPFGFKRVTTGLGEKALQPIPEQQQAIRLMQKLHAKKSSLREIAQRVHKVHGITITHMGVQNVLRREEAKSQSKSGKKVTS